ncbi:MAG: NUDIX domain-containing protein [Eubacteriales bacterium]
MINIEQHTTKARAYLFYNGYFLFMFGWGIDYKDNKLGVVRFGGHREKGESTVECVIREVREETSLHIDLFNNNIVYTLKNDMTIIEKTVEKEDYAPILVKIGDNSAYSVMYLAYGKGELKPDMETQGILLLRKEDITTICSRDITFSEYKDLGGKYILAKPLPDNGVLSPNIQLRFLSKLFLLEPNLMSKFMTLYPCL